MTLDERCMTLCLSSGDEVTYLRSIVVHCLFLCIYSLILSFEVL